MRRQSIALLNQSHINKFTETNSAEDFVGLQCKLWNSKCSTTFYEVSETNMRNTISRLQHQLDQGNDLISTFQHDIEEATRIEDVHIERLESVSAQVCNLLASRRDVQHKLNKARSLASTDRGVMSKLLSSTISGKMT